MRDKPPRLTPFEEYLLAEDRPDYPCWIIVKFHFSGGFEREALQDALDRTLVRNPLLRSVVKRQGRRLYWHERRDWKLPIEWLSGPLPGGWPEWHALDLFQEPGFRLALVGCGPNTEMIFHVHHAIFDGKALRDVCSEILSHYSAEIGHPVAIPILKPEIFTRRNRLGETWIERLKTWPTQILGLWLTVLYQKRKIAPIAPDPLKPVQPLLPSEYTKLVSHRLPEAVFRRVRDEAMRLKVTTNELFIRDLFFSLGEWRTWKAGGEEEEWVRMVMAVDMRKPVDRFLSAANVTSVICIDRRAKALRNRERLLARAHEEMSWVKHRGLRFTFWTLLAFCRLKPDGIRRYSQRPGCQGTIIFANHGQLNTRSPLRNKHRKIEVPGAILEDITMVSPLREGTTAALVIGSYAGNLLADLHYDPRYHTEAEASGLLRIFIEQLNRYEGKSSQTF
ncbi:MAG: hypothetical protein RLZZ505_1349 [Verrucomicrobiota bacterium]|jgi:NRPS condensation-like uncharacterized protein